jgi:DNA-binding MarR family transcriptional regulator
MSNIQVNIDPQGIPGFVLWQVSKLWQRKLAVALKPYDIGGTEFVVLGNTVRLSQLGQIVTPASLMDATKVDRMTASQTIRSLEKKHLIERVNAPDDKRTFQISPTQDGIKLADDALGKVIDAHNQFFSPIHAQTEQYLEIMQKLIGGNGDETI